MVVMGLKNKIHLLNVLFLSFILGSAGKVLANDKTSAAVPYIINGSESKIEQFPYMGLLVQDHLDNAKPYIVSLCGVTILDESHVLTAAHCVEASSDTQRQNNEKLAVIFNVQNIQPDAFNQTMYYVDSIYYPDNYNDPTFKHDIAILNLVTPISSNDVSSSEYVKLSPNESDYVSNNFPFTLIGYGNTGPETSDSNQSNHLQQATVKYADLSTCQKYYSVDDSQICVTGVERDNLLTGACQGDSGGPLLYTKNGQVYQAGIVSYGPPSCGDTNIEIQSVYTNVFTYSGWIASVLSGAEEPKQNINNYLESDEKETSGGGLGAFGLILLTFVWRLRNRTTL